MTCIHCINESVVIDRYNEPLCRFHNRERHTIKEGVKKGGYRYGSKERNSSTDSC